MAEFLTTALTVRILAAIFLTPATLFMISNAPDAMRRHSADGAHARTISRQKFGAPALADNKSSEEQGR